MHLDCCDAVLMEVPLQSRVKMVEPGWLGCQNVEKKHFLEKKQMFFPMAGPVSREPSMLRTREMLVLGGKST